MVIAGVFLWREYGQKSQIPAEEVTPNFQMYENKKARFSLMIPTGWRIEEATDEGKFVARVVFIPTAESIKVGNIGELSVTVVATPSANQPLATQDEFDYWLTQPIGNSTDGAVVKIANETVAGKMAVRLAEVEAIPQEPGLKFWSVTSWFRREGLNYYINMMGNGTDFKSESGPFLWMLSKFLFLP